MDDPHKPDSMKFLFAPVQGYTDVAYRTLHHRVVGGVDEYYTPFLRYEHHTIRNKDRRDVDPQLNEGTPTVPQVIARDVDELRTLVDFLAEQGWRRIDLNMGCPFHLQTGAGRGSGLLPHVDRVETLLQAAAQYGDIRFSAKMRLGLESPDESMALLPLLNASCLTRIVLHPRLGRQQYKGRPDMEAFALFYEGCTKPIVFNGDITTVEQMEFLSRQYPRLEGLMIGRGLLARPTLAREWREGCAMDAAERWPLVLRFHQAVLDEARLRLRDSQPVLDRMKAFWEYQEEGMGRKLWKAVKKCQSMERYPL